MALNAKAPAWTMHQVEIALEDPEPAIRLRIVMEPTFSPTEQQFMRAVDRGTPEAISGMLARTTASLAPLALKHPSALSRSLAYSLPSIHLSPEQVNAGIQDTDRQVRLAVVSRTDFHPSAQQIETLLAIGDSQAISAAGKKANEECVGAAISLSYPLVDRIVSEAADITSAQLKQCLADQRCDVALAALERRHQKLTKEHLAIGMRSQHEAVRVKAMSLYGIGRLSAQQLEERISDTSGRIRSLIIACTISNYLPMRLNALYQIEQFASEVR